MPWFGQKGGGIQYELEYGIDYYIRNEYIEVLK
jgi:hypothetical protein